MSIVENGRPTLTFHQWWDQFIRKLEGILNSITANITAIQAAQEAVNIGIMETARLNSYTNPTVVVTAADVGATATITIAAHTRVYPVNGPYDIADVAITAGSITGLGFSTKYWVYYDDTTLSSSAPTFLATTVAADSQVGAAYGRHFVGVITTPADGAGGTTGTGGTPPGNGGILP